MAKTFPLQSILDLSQMRLDEATRRLGELISGEQRAAQQLDVLIQYRDEYHARFLEAARAGLNRDQWRNYQSFLERLDAAIGQANDLVAQSRSRTAAGQQDWLHKRGRLKAFDTLAQRHQVRVDHAEARQEQKELDEHGMRLHGAKNSAEEP